MSTAAKLRADKPEDLAVIVQDASAAFSDVFKDATARSYAELDIGPGLVSSFRDIAARVITDAAAPANVRDRAYMAYRRLLLVDASPVYNGFDLPSYLEYLELDRDPKKRCYLPRKRVIKPLALSMQRLALPPSHPKRLDLLTVSLPPGTGKSTLGIFTLSWLMGRSPDSPNLASGHSGTLTRSFYDGVLEIIQSGDYLWSDVFPGVELAATNTKETTIDLNKPHRFSTLTTRALNATLTGATRCEGLLYADDLCSGIEEAMSKDRLDKLWTSYTTDLKSRKKDGCAELHIATRWSVLDVIGRLQNENEGNERAKFIAVPALDENGESNFEYKYNVGFSKSYFHDMKKAMDDASYRALYENQPVEREGQLYSPDELRRYYSLPQGEPEAVLAVCDTKTTGTDYMFMPVFCVWNKEHYLIDCVYSNATVGVEEELAALLVRQKVSMCQFESNAAGGHVAANVAKIVKKLGGKCSISTKFTTANKETKIIVNSPWVKTNVLFPAEDRYSDSSDLGKAIAALCGYVVAGKNKHDDVPDGLAMYALFVQGSVPSTCEVRERPF